jgi:hypothetical protein
MVREADIALTCRECGQEFTLTSAEQEFYRLKGFNMPTRCKQCRKQAHSPAVSCSHCGTEMEKGTPVYCSGCMQSAHQELEKKNEQIKMAVSAVKAKLEASEARKAELTELLRQKEQELEELEYKAQGLTEDLEKAQQFYAASGWLQPVLGEIVGRMEDLERAQRDIASKVVQTIRVLQDRYENMGILEMIKRNLRQSLKEGA